MNIPIDTKVAVFAANFDMASQVVKGTLTGFHEAGETEYGLIEIEEIYNSSPPITGIIYPPGHKTKPKVTKFTL